MFAQKQILAAKFGLVYNHVRCQSTSSRAGGKIDQQLLKDAAILTGIGMGTAFLLLVALSLIVMVIGRLPARFTGAAESRSTPGDEESTARDKALAAVVAVAALTNAAAPHRRGE